MRRCETDGIVALRNGCLTVKQVIPPFYLFENQYVLTGVPFHFSRRLLLAFNEFKPNVQSAIAAACRIRLLYIKVILYNMQSCYVTSMDSQFHLKI